MPQPDRLPLLGETVHYWFDDYTFGFAIVAKTPEPTGTRHRPKINITVLSPESSKWLSKVDVDPVITDGIREYKALRWAFPYEFEPDPTPFSQ